MIQTKIIANTQENIVVIRHKTTPAFAGVVLYFIEETFLHM